ncbi:ubiquitin elongating factor core-domain-containing protein [Globomyces pollinis-pini]|nr:ubiquitin elongating factor core-domain-containing protein [Globomyces pollinis-pini]
MKSLEEAFATTKTVPKQPIKNKSAATSPSVPSKSPLEVFLSYSDNEWEHIICDSVLTVALTNQPNKIFIQSVAEELQNENRELQMISEHWERILYARLTLSENNSSDMPVLFDYLVQAWIRINVRIQNLTKLCQDQSTIEVTSVATRRLEKLKEFSALTMNYTSLVIHPDMIDMFPQNHSFGAGYWGAQMAQLDDIESKYPREFVIAFIKRFADEGLAEILNSTVKSILTVMRSKRIYDNHQNCFRAFTFLISFKEFAELIPTFNDWNPDFANARSVEFLSILGPLLSQTSIFPDSDPALADRYFGGDGTYPDSMFEPDGRGLGSRNLGNVNSAMMSLRDASNLVQMNLHSIFLSLIKTGPAAKEKVLSYLWRVLTLNAKRGQLQVNRIEVSTDGYMHNLLQVCKKLSEPIMDLSFSKIGLIDSSFFLHSNRFDHSETTRINVDNESCKQITKEWLDTHPISPPNFVTEIFFLTLSYHHFGLLSTIRYYKNFVKELEDMQKNGARHAAMRDSGQWATLDPMMRNANEQGMIRLQKELDKLLGIKLAMEAGLFDKAMLEQSIQFYGLVMVWLIKCAAGSNSKLEWFKVAQGNPLGLSLFPLAPTPVIEFITLPEWIIEDICEFYLFLMRYQAPIFEHHPRNEFIAFSMVMLSNSALIKNPYLKSKLVEILYSFTLPLWRTASGETLGRLDAPFVTHPYAKTHLVPAILGFYIEVEQTGMSSQFYDKFNIRYNISQILKSLWLDHAHRSIIVKLSHNTDFFVKFVALLMNDTTFLLDESLSKLKEIGTIQTELSIPLASTATQQERQTRQEREGALQSAERQAMSYMSLANETVHMLSYLTGNPEIVGPFMANEIVDRLAAMLDFNLVALAGPRCTELKVKNPEKYRFDPRKLLSELVDIFIHLSHRSEFVAAVARDERSFDKAVFQRAASILNKHSLKSPDELSQLIAFVGHVEVAVRENVMEEEELGDIPDEFLDPLLFTLMEDPVTLPSGVNIDLSTLRSHLLSDQHDPFNRQPLKLEDAIPNVELKKKIVEWKELKRKNKQGTAMDLS